MFVWFNNDDDRSQCHRIWSWTLVREISIHQSRKNLISLIINDNLLSFLKKGSLLKTSTTITVMNYIYMLLILYNKYF